MHNEAKVIKFEKESSNPMDKLELELSPAFGTDTKISNPGRYLLGVYPRPVSEDETVTRFCHWKNGHRFGWIRGTNKSYDLDGSKKFFSFYAIDPMSLVNDHLLLSGNDPFPIAINDFTLISHQILFNWTPKSFYNDPLCSSMAFKNTIILFLIKDIHYLRCKLDKLQFQEITIDQIDAEISTAKREKAEAKEFKTDVLNWFRRRAVTEIIFEIRKRDSKRQIELVLPNVAEPIFNEIFLKHNGKKWFPEIGGTITFYDEQTEWTSINKKDPKYSFLPCSFVCDVLNDGYNFDQTVENEVLSPIFWNVRYEKKTGNLMIFANIRWGAVDGIVLMGKHDWHANDDKYSYRPPPPTKANKLN